MAQAVSPSEKEHRRDFRGCLCLNCSISCWPRTRQPIVCLIRPSRGMLALRPFPPGSEIDVGVGRVQCDARRSTIIDGGLELINGVRKLLYVDMCSALESMRAGDLPPRGENSVRDVIEGR